jgi:DNA gyrase subunit A
MSDLPPSDDAVDEDEEGALAATLTDFVGGVEEIEFQEEMERSFLEYAMSVITARALPDVRDGLKPVHRRILYGMHDMGARSDRPRMKCARVSGEVMGKFHPHGDASIYDALVRMAQPFSLREPLIDFHGNLGSPDFPAAAARYCITGDTIVRLADGTSMRIADLVDLPADSERDIDVDVLDKDGKPVHASKAFNSGVHPTKRITTKSGFSLRGSHNHPVLCLESIAGVPIFQWRMLTEITEGTVVCLARNAWANVVPRAREMQLGVLCGAWVSEGFASEGRAGFNNTDRDFFDEVVEAYDALIGGPRYTYSRHTRVDRKEIHELDVQNMAAFRAGPLGELVGAHAAQKFIPTAVWQGGWGVKRAFLMACFEGDGGVRNSEGTFNIQYTTYSECLAGQLQQLLADFGVIATRHRYTKASGAIEHRLLISGQRNMRAFAERVGFLRTKQAKLESLLRHAPVRPHRLSQDHAPYVADFVRDELAERGRGSGRSWLMAHNFDRIERWETERLRIIDRIKDPEILATILPIMDSGYRYERVVSVRDEEPAAVYSIRVDSEDHSFLAGGFVNHNTECRLALLANELLAGIDENTVDFEPNYTYEFEQPSVLPSRFPNLLVNGSQAIAVGMATNIPPHNLGEVIEATVHLIDNPNATPDDLMHFVHGPDFPTGGLILGRQGILDAYRTGRGSIRVRAKTEIEEDKKGGVSIVVTELPYQASVNAIETRIAELVNNRELDGIRSFDNLSSGIDTKLVIGLKRDANALVVLNNLFKHTQLQSSFAVNMVALCDGIPRTLNLVQALQYYIDHQVDVITRRSQFRLKKAQDRAHIVEGLLKALDMIDAIITLVRASEDRAAARTGLMAKPFEFSEIQANHILDMTISRLTRLSRTEYDQEMKDLRVTIKELEDILSKPEVLRGVIKTELGELSAKFANPRRAIITHDPGELGAEDFINDEPLVFLMTRAGYVKTVAAGAFRTQGRGGRGIAGAKLKEEDLISDVIHTTAHEFVLFFSNKGRVFRLKAHEIPMKERTARGTPVINLLPLEPEEKIQAVIATRDYPEDKLLLFATKKGIIKKTPFSEYDKSRREGFIAITLKDGDELQRVLTTSGTDDIFLVTKSGATLRFDEETVRPTGRSAQGVIGMRLRADDEVVSCDVARDDTAILIVTDAGFGKRTQLDKFPRKGRGGLGMKGIKLTAKRGFVVAAFMVGLDDEIMVAASNGTTARMPVRQISSQGRDATGVRVMNLDDGATLATAAPIIQAEEEEA